MANPTPDYPAAIHNRIDVSAFAGQALGDTTPKQTEVIGKLEEEVYAVQHKVGRGSGNAEDAGSGQVLTADGAGGSSWEDPSGGGGGGGASGESVVRAVTQSSHGLAVGDVVRYNGTSYVKSIASDRSTAYAVGVVSAVADANNFEMVLSGRITGLSGLTAGKAYFLSDSVAGDISNIAPIANGTVSKPILFATSTTTGVVNIQRGHMNVVSNAYSRMGINFGYAALSDEATIKRDLRYIGQYTNRLRISIPSWNNSTGITNMRALVGIAQAMGFRTTYGVTAAWADTGSPANLTYVNNWLTQVDTEAAWADANGVDLFYIGNEEDHWISAGGITGLTTTDLREAVLNKAQSLKGTYPNLRLVYSTAESQMADWSTEAETNPDWQYLDSFGLNIYNADFDGTVDYALSLAYADRLFISEWNDEENQPTSGLSDSAYRAVIAERAAVIRSRSIEAYFFNWDWGSNYGDPEDWGLSNGDGTFKPGFEQVFSIPR